jgi:UDP-glucose 4-epimerase
MHNGLDKISISSPINSKILVIGGSGYVGAHLVKQLAAAGRLVTVLGRSFKPRYKLPDNVNYVVGDFSNLGLIIKLLDEHQEVIHLAYASVPNTSFDNPLSDLLQNLPPTLQLFSEAALRGVKIILVSSGGTVYGDAATLPVNESFATKPISPYGVTKLTLENYAYLYAVTHNLQFVCVRPANAYGVGQRAFTGQGFIATAMTSIMRREPIKVFGDRGTIRDYIYVSDLASGIFCALEKGLQSETYNIGSGVGHSNMDIVESLIPLMNKMGYEVKVENLPERLFDVKANVLDSAKLHIQTGWKPQISLEDGLRYTFEWLETLKL